MLSCDGRELHDPAPPVGRFRRAERTGALRRGSEAQQVHVRLGYFRDMHAHGTAVGDGWRCSDIGTCRVRFVGGTHGERVLMV
jgi:hypothetical protein